MPTTFFDPPRPFAPLRVLGAIEVDGFDNRARLASNAIATVIGSLNALVNVSAGTTSNNLGSVVFANTAGGVSFGLNGSTITAVAPSSGGNEFQITVGSATAWTDFDIAAACPGIQSGDIVSILFTAAVDLTINNIIPPHSAFWCWIGIRATSGLAGRIVFKDTLNRGGVGTAANSFRTPGSSYGDPNPPDFVIASEEGWTAIGYTAISTIWRIMQPTSGLGLSIGTVTGPQNVYSGLSFNNGNKVSFGITGSTITASVASSLTAINVSGGTTSANLTAITFSNANGVSFGLNPSANTILTASIAIPTVSFSAGTQNRALSAITFNDSNGVSFGLTGSTITASVATSLTNINVSAGTTSRNLSALTLSNSNNVSFGLSGSVITASASVATSLTNINVSAGTTSNNLSALTFNNSNGVSFGLNGSVVTASVSPGAALINLSAGTTSNNLTAFTVANANGVSFGLNASTLTASIATSLTNINVSAGTTSNNLSAVTFSNANGVSFGLNGSVVTGSIASSLTAINLSAGTTSNNLTAFTLSNSNNVSFGLNGSVVTGTVQPGVSALSAGTTNATSGGVSFANGNNVSFGLNGQTLTGSVATSLTNINVSAGTTSQNLSAITFSNLNGVSFGLNGSTVTASIATSLTNINVSAGTTSNNLSALTFSNSNGVSFGLNGSVVTASQSTLVYSNANNVTFGIAGSTLTASVTVASTQGLITVSAGGSSVALSNLVFTNTNNVGWAISTAAGGGTVRAAASINFSAGTTSGNLSNIVYSNSNGVSFGLNGSTVTASIATSLTNINVSAGTTSNNLSAITFSNLNGVSFGLNGSVVTASINPSAGGGVAIKAVSDSTNGVLLQTDGTVSFQRGDGGLTNEFNSAAVGNIRFQLSGTDMHATALMRITANLNATGTGGFGVSKFQFQNSNGVTFGVATTSNADGKEAIFTASVGGLVAISDTYGNLVSSGTMFLSQGTRSTITSVFSNYAADLFPNVYFRVNGQSMQAVALMQVATSTEGANQAICLRFPSSNGVTFGYQTTNLSAGSRVLDITASISNPPIGGFANNVNANNAQVAMSLFSNRVLFFQPFPNGVPFGAGSSASNSAFGSWIMQIFNSINSASSTNNVAVAGGCASQGLTMRYGLYSAVNTDVTNGTVTLVASGIFSGNIASGGVVFSSAGGGRFMRVGPLSPADGLSAGQWIMGAQFSMGNSTDARISLAGELQGLGPGFFNGFWGQPANSTCEKAWHGLYSTTTAALPSSLVTNQLNRTVADWQSFLPFVSVIASNIPQ